jgi:tRNA threonylcarbamoyl adenosine modification protein (Sua5/YciO/YrdC/YwlC family)
MIYAINEKNPQMRLIKKAVALIREGSVIIYPTDTVYGMGCDLFQKKSIEKIYEIKRRSYKQPFSFICADLKEVSRYAIVSNYAYKTMKRLLPGPYTFILEASRMVPKLLQTNRKATGIRVPDNEICLSLVRELGNPIITTSVSTPEGGTLNEPEEMEKRFRHCADLIIDGGLLTPRLSSIISLINDVPEVIRIGKGDVSEFL